jgi:hypothetical protein
MRGTVKTFPVPWRSASVLPGATLPRGPYGTNIQ